jgi:septum formation protein
MAKSNRLILASGSSGRRELLERAGYEFEVRPSHVDEPTGDGVSDPRAFVQQVAWSKAAAVARLVKEGLVLAADSVGWHRGKIIGKPVDRADARRILLDLSGTRHELWSGVCLWQRPGDLQIAWQEVSIVEMAEFKPDQLENYLDTGIWEGKSGAYAIQEVNDPLVRLVAGSMSNVVGLPMESLTHVLAWLESSGGSILRADHLNLA